MSDGVDQDEGREQQASPLQRFLIVAALVLASVIIATLVGLLARRDADEYASLAALADDLTARGKTCHVQESTVLPVGEKFRGGEVGRCLIDGHPAFLGVYRDVTETPHSVAAGLSELPDGELIVVAVGPNWTVATLDEETTRAIAEVMAAELVEAETDSTS